MGKIIKFVKTIRNNWKKSLFAATVVSFGANYGKNSYDTRQVMRRYCEEAAKYGDETQPLNKSLRRVTVILNPVANKKSCKDMFEKYCAPLMHLAGLMVTIVQTEYAGQAKDLPASLDPNTDALIIAGGDGTLSEAVTGLLRRAEGNLKALSTLPIAVLPLGRTNEFASSLFGNEDEVQSMAEATMAVIDGFLRPVDVIKIEPTEEEGKAIYSLARVEWGAHRDVRSKRDKYWIFGPWREHISYLLAGSPEPCEWECEYCEPCLGCSKCHTTENTNRRWWHAFLPRSRTAAHLLVPNESCGIVQEKKISTVRFSIATDTVSVSATQLPEVAPLGPSKISFEVGPPEQGMFHLASEGFAKINGTNPEPEEVVPVRYLRIKPAFEATDEWFSIDNEDFEVKPIALTLLPKTLNIFTPRPDRKF